MKPLKVMTYNIQGHAAGRREDHLPKLAEVIAAVNPDVVGLQEVHCRTRAGPMHQGEVLAHLTGLTHWFGRSCAMDGGDYGNAVLGQAIIAALGYLAPMLTAGGRLWAQVHSTRR